MYCPARERRMLLSEPRTDYTDRSADDLPRERESREPPDMTGELKLFSRTA